MNGLVQRRPLVTVLPVLFTVRGRRGLLLVGRALRAVAVHVRGFSYDAWVWRIRRMWGEWGEWGELKG
jgi:hypothetical protein